MSEPARIHPTAQVDPRAVVSGGCTIGAFCVVGPDVTLGAGSEMLPHSVLMGPAVLGESNRIFPFASLGLEPQDLKYRGEPTTLKVGDRNTFREGVTVHRGTAGGGGETRIGSDNLLMASSHVAHDCSVGDRTIFANAATLAGHVTVQDGATIGAFSGVHQFCRIGRDAYIGGYSVLTQDAAPFMLTVGNRAKTYGVNVIGLQRKNFSAETIQALRHAYRLLFRARLPMKEAQERLRSESGSVREVLDLLDFVAGSERGVIR